MNRQNPGKARFCPLPNLDERIQLGRVVQPLASVRSRRLREKFAFLFPDGQELRIHLESNGPRAWANIDAPANVQVLRRIGQPIDEELTKWYDAMEIFESMVSRGWYTSVLRQRQRAAS